MTSFIPIRERMQFMSTVQLIRGYGRWVVLHRNPDRVDDGAGGVVTPDGGPATLTQQFMYLGAKATVFPQEVHDTTGQQLTSDHVILGLPRSYAELIPLDIQADDWFTFNGDMFVVTFVHRDKRYQVKAEARVVT